MATDLASRMVRSWGMSDLGPLSYAKDEEHIFIGREIAQHRDFSEETARRIDEEITKFIDNGYEKATSVLKENIDILHRLSEILLEKETVMGSELDALILEMRPGFDFPSKHEYVSSVEPEADAATEGAEESTTDEEDTSEASTEDSAPDEASGKE
jgi:cell division protease FtsH